MKEGVKKPLSPRVLYARGGTSMFSVPGMCRWTGYSFHHPCSRAGYRFLQKCSQKGILFSIFCSQTGLQCLFVILCSQTGCGFLPFCSQTGVFKLRKMLPDRVKITAPQRHTPVHIRTKCPPPGPLRAHWNFGLPQKQIWHIQYAETMNP